MTTPPDPLILNPVTVDYPGIFSSIQSDLIAADAIGNPNGWTNLVQSGTGTTIIRWIASIGAFAQGAIARSLQENYLDTARSPSGVLRCVRLQGVHIIRAQPGEVTVSITRTDNLTTPLIIPTFSQWTIGGQSFYNAPPITLSGTGAAVTATLKRGTIATSTFNSSGLPYQTYILGAPNLWSITDVNIFAIDVNGNMWTGTRTGLWRYEPTDQVFFDSTLPDGTAELKFGDGTYGAIPPLGTLKFYYVNLATSAATNIGLAVGSTGKASNLAVAAITTSVASPNVDPPPPEFYKAIGPGGPANNGRAVTRDDHRAIALEYPGVVDALFRGQAELNPSDIRWMNVIAVTLLTTSVWNELEWLAFKQYFETIGIATTSFVRMDPVAIPVTVVVDIAINQTASVASITSMANQVITNYFTPSNTSLNMALEPSDIPLALMESATYLQAPGESGAWIDYIRVRSPSGPVVAPPTSYLTLTAPPTLNVYYSRRGQSAASTGAVIGL